MSLGSDTSLWDGTPGSFDYSLYSGTVTCLPIAYPITVPEGIYSAQGRIFVTSGIHDVGEPIFVYIGNNQISMLDWDISLSYANNYGISLWLHVSNNTPADMFLSFSQIPYLRLKINGVMTAYNPVPADIQIEVPPHATRTMPIHHFTYLNNGIYDVQAYVLARAPDNFVPVGPEMQINIGIVHELTIGDGCDNYFVPIDISFNHSLYEGIFNRSDLQNRQGTISSMAFYNSFPADFELNTPVKVYLGATLLEDLTEGFVPTEQLSLVYDGNLYFPPGENQIRFILDNPFYLPRGQNLIMRVVRSDDSSPVISNALFLCQPSNPGNGRLALSEHTPIDPSNPPDLNFLQGKTPKSTLYFSAMTDNEDPVQTPVLHSLLANPNPFGQQTKVIWKSPEPSYTELSVFNLRGQLIKRLLAEHKHSGNHEITWRGDDDQGTAVKNGIYLIR
ncbi:MAG: FlgD immunoglobulin-like domain containing protein, partial [Candidatus Cloacimonadaceae bacterium]|nr:FlgD immunoglobulin-like domain containing protein [Candidatus Cloacimonadaceae bacterium]